ncbi:hypothetical protein B2M26_09050 [Ferroacidibacillus organovorans]|nr:hypothetical protein B2M26_09050 [Ferroacidibacillus organovorans]
MLLVEEVGEVAKEVRRLLHATDDAVRQGAHDHLREELADCLAFIAKLANYTDIDLQQAYVEKMTKNIGRNWLE